MNGPSGAGADTVLIDGVAAERIGVLDRGLHYGDGLFETIACRAGRPRFLALHLERLAAGCERLRIRFEQAAALRAEVERLAAAADASLVKVIVTRGPATARGYAPRGDEQARRIVLQYPWPQEDPARGEAGVAVRIARLRLGENPALAGLKHLCRLEQVLARAECAQAQVAELLLFSSSGRLISGTMSNVFLVQGGRLRTARLDRCGVAGIMRRVVLREALRARIAAEECTLTAADLEDAEEVFMTNARIGVWPVRAVDARTLEPGPLTRRVQGLIRPLLDDPVDA